MCIIIISSWSSSSIILIILIILWLEYTRTCPHVNLEIFCWTMEHPSCSAVECRTSLEMCQHSQNYTVHRKTELLYECILSHENSGVLNSDKSLNTSSILSSNSRPAVDMEWYWRSIRTKVSTDYPTTNNVVPFPTICTDHPLQLDSFHSGWLPNTPPTDSGTIEPSTSQQP